MQMVWCMLWGEWALTRPPRPRYVCMSPVGTAGFRYPPCPHPAMGPPPSCTGTRSMSWVRAWGMWEGGSESRNPHPHRLAGIGIRLSSGWQNKRSFVGVIHACSDPWWSCCGWKTKPQYLRDCRVDDSRAGVHTAGCGRLRQAD